MMIKKLFVLIIILNGLFFVSAETISDDLHLNIQTTNSAGTVVTGTFDFVFNISTTSDCSNILYSNSTTLTTDSRGIISYYLPDVILDYSQQYWLCYYRDGSLINASKMTRTPYTFRANISDYLDSERNYEMANLTLGQKITFALGEIIDNIVDGWVRITGGLNVTEELVVKGDLTVNNSVFFVNSTSGNVGLGTSSPSEKLDVVGNAEINGNIIVTGTVDGIDIAARDHAESHTVVSHSDTTATGTELNTLTDNSIANTLHRHSELVASDGAPDPAVSVDAGGIVSMPHQSGCRVRLTSDQIIPTGVYTKLQFGTEDWDIQNEFDNVTNYRFTAKQAGYYLIILNGAISSMSDGKNIALSIRKNGTDINMARSMSSFEVSSLYFTTSTITDLDVGDYLEGFIYHDHGANKATVATAYQNYMSIMKIA